MSSNRLRPLPRRWTWRRAVGILAVTSGIASILLSFDVAFELKGIVESQDSPWHDWTNAAAAWSIFLPPALVVTVVLAIVAGTETGRSRRLGNTAGILALASFPLWFVACLLLPTRY